MFQVQDVVKCLLKVKSLFLCSNHHITRLHLLLTINLHTFVTT